MRFYCIAFIEYMFAGKTLLDYNNLFSSNDHNKNDMIIYKYFKAPLSVVEFQFVHLLH